MREALSIYSVFNILLNYIAVYNNQIHMASILIQLGANTKYQEPSTSRTILDWGLYFNF
jgi:hypothetical protein